MSMLLKVVMLPRPRYDWVGKCMHFKVLAGLQGLRDISRSEAETFENLFEMCPGSLLPFSPDSSRFGTIGETRLLDPNANRQTNERYLLALISL